MRNVIEYKNLIWIDIIEPNEEDIEYIKNKFALHPLTLEAVIPPIHYPDIDVFRNNIFIILHHPHSKENGEIQIQEFDIILGKNYLITNHYEKITPLNGIFDECSKSDTKKKEYMEKGVGFLFFTILNRFLKETLFKIDQIESEIDLIEKEIFLEKEKKMVKEISHLKRKIIDLWRVVEPQRAVFDSLRDAGVIFLGQEFKHYFSTLFRTHRKIENALRTAREAIKSLEETNHILVTLKMNEIMGTLTIFSVILLPLTLLASIWGMNTNFLPFIKNPFDFWIIIALMLLTFSGMIIYFRIKKWL